ncbi:sulfurtransferase TusA family protein [Pokkaliibacter sp. CJK22405]|uniref:sulfurtransferase TusA family protein n=1 Tax=Pokkaliibacter sp. CJK22405 TaxID=3384615 RepID=UPI003984E137
MLLETPILDATGLACPLPLLKTKLALKPLSSGETLHVLATDAGAERDIPAFVNLSPHVLVRSTVEEGIYHFWITKGESA